MRIAAVALLVVGTGCSSCKKKQTPVAETPGSAAGSAQLADAAASAEAPPPSSDAAVLVVAGFYKGQWGQLLLREQDGKLRAVYSHDKGTITGTLKGDTLVGWWCEAPSRNAPKDAGDVELKFVMRPTGLVIDGRWRYGAEDKWRDDWDIERVDAEPPPELGKRFDDTDAFCEKPEKPEKL